MKGLSSELQWLSKPHVVQIWKSKQPSSSPDWHLESCGPGQTFWGSKGFSLVFALLLMQQKMFFTLDLSKGALHMPLMAGRQAFLEILHAAGVEYIIGNPGPIEVPLL